MTDYSNWREWKEVKLYNHIEYFQQYEKYSPEGVKNLCDKLLKIGIDSGLEGCHLTFESNREPYEDYLSNPSVCVVGYRRLNSPEKKQIQDEDLIKERAEKLGITVYEAKMLKQLEDKGVVK